MNNVVEFPGPVHSTCECGNVWWQARVVVDHEGVVQSLAWPLVCIECGAEIVAPS